MLLIPLEQGIFLGVLLIPLKQNNFLLIPLERGTILGVLLIPLKQEQFLFMASKYYSNKGTIPFNLQ